METKRVVWAKEPCRMTRLVRLTERGDCDRRPFLYKNGGLTMSRFSTILTAGRSGRLDYHAAVGQNAYLSGSDH